MSKDSLFWGKARGKLGETVLYRAGGEQRTRSYVKNIKNPKTYAQMVNRIRMGNLVSAFRISRAILDNSFPNRPANQSAFNAFVQANAGGAGYAIMKEDIDKGVCIPYDMIYSKGNIPIDTNLSIGQVKELDKSEVAAKYAFIWDGISVPKAEHELPNGSTPADFGKTGAQMYALLVGDTNPNGLPSKFKITVIFGVYGPAGNQCEMYRPGFAQIECSQNSTDTWHITSDPTNSYNVPMIYPASGEYRTDASKSKHYFTPESLAIGQKEDTEDILDASICAIILSWSENGKTRVTTSKICVANIYGELASQFAVGGDQWTEVLESYGYTNQSTLATK